MSFLIIIGFCFYLFLSMIVLKVLRVSVSIKYAILVFVCLFCLFLSLSKDSATSYDTYNYIYIYENYFPETIAEYLNNFDKYEFEYGFTILSIAIKLLGLEYSGYFFIITLISVLCVFLVLVKDVNDVLFAIFIYVFCFYFRNEVIIIRFGLSSALFLLGLSLLNNKKWAIALICFFCSFLMHYTGLVSFILLAFYYIGFNRSSYYFLIPIAFVGFLISPLLLLSSLLSMFPQLSYIGLDRIVRYIGFEGSAGIKGVLIYLPFLCFCFKYHKQLYIRYKPYLASFILSVYSMILFHEVATLSRVYLYFSMSLIVLIPGICNIATKRDSFLLYSYSIFVFLYIFLRQNFFNSGGSINFY